MPKTATPTITVDYEGTRFGDFTSNTEPHISHCRVWTAEGQQLTDEWILAFLGEDGKARSWRCSVYDQAALGEALQRAAEYLTTRPAQTESDWPASASANALGHSSETP